MKLISSRMTFFHKRIFPLFWFGIIGFVFVGALFATIKNKAPFHLPLILIPLGMAVFGYFIMKALVFDLMDEAWDAGDAIIVKKKNKEEHIQLSNIKNVSYSNFSNPQRVTLTLRKPCLFGDEVTFSPTISFSPFKKNPIVQDLIERVDAKRQG
jgi:hypothetical protein